MHHRLTCGLYQAEISKYACELRFYCLNTSFWKWFVAASARCAGCNMDVCVWPYKRSEIWLSLLEPWQECGSASEAAWWCKKKHLSGTTLDFNNYLRIIFFMTCYVAQHCVVGGWTGLIIGVTWWEVLKAPQRWRLPQLCRNSKFKIEEKHRYVWRGGNI